MTDDELETELRDHYRSIDPGQPPARLGHQIDDTIDRQSSRSRTRVRFRPALGLGLGVLVIAVLGLAVLAFRPEATGTVVGSPAPSSLSPSAPAVIASPTDISTSPYQLTLLGGSGSPITVTSPADCQPLPTDWLHQFCALALRSDWRTIIAPTDPFAPPPNATSSVTFLASVARAEISGDTSLCSDVAMREWLSAAPGGAAPPAGATNPPRHPISTCIEVLRDTAAKGSFTVTDPDNEHTVAVFVDPGAAEKAGSGSAPAIDPAVFCMSGLTRDACDLLIQAVTNDADSQAPGWLSLLASGPDTVCDSAQSPCPSPAGDTSLGTVQVGLSGGAQALFDIVEANGQIKVIDIGSQGGVPATVLLTVQTLGDPHITLYPPGSAVPAISSGTAYQVCSSGVGACLPEPPTAITLARMTDTAYGTVSPSGTVTLPLNKTLVWAISWIGSDQCVFSGGGTGARPSAPSVQPLCDHFAFVDATTGKFIFASSFAHR